jgi:hypothetical protein
MECAPSFVYDKTVLRGSFLITYEKFSPEKLCQSNKLDLQGMTVTYSCIPTHSEYTVEGKNYEHRVRTEFQPVMCVTVPTHKHT